MACKVERFESAVHYKNGTPKIKPFIRSGTIRSAIDKRMPDNITVSYSSREKTHLYWEKGGDLKFSPIINVTVLNDDGKPREDVSLIMESGRTHLDLVTGEGVVFTFKSGEVMEIRTVIEK